MNNPTHILTLISDGRSWYLDCDAPSMIFHNNKWQDADAGDGFNYFTWVEKEVQQGVYTLEEIILENE